MSFIEEAYQQVCDDAEKAEGCWVSLYCDAPFYGGPEEGGWWGNDTVLVESKHFASKAQAEAVKAKVEETAKLLTKDAMQAHGQLCASQLDSCGWDGELAQSRYGEVDGPSEYFVIIEQVSGANQAFGSRHYE